MSKIGTGITPIEKLTATEVEATTYTGLPAETVTTLVDNADNTFTYTSEDATVTNFDSEHTLSEPVANTIRLTKPDGTFDEVTVSGGGGTSTTGLVKNTVQTTDATVTTIATIPITDDTAEAIEALISGDGPTGKNYWARIVVGVRRDGGGGATIVGVADITADDEGTPGYAATVTVSGNDFLIQVQGAVAETVDWTSQHLNSAGAGGGLTIADGSEITTLDTYNGKTIYLKAIDFGALANSGTKNVAHGITSLDRILDFSFVADDGTRRFSMQYSSGGNSVAYIDGANIVNSTTINWSTYTGKLIVKYTKV